MEGLIRQVLEKFPQQVKVVVKQFPLTNHKFAFEAALGAMAAADQGKFWEFHTALLENHADMNSEKIREIAAGLKLDMARFEARLNSGANRNLILEDINQGRKIGVPGTPSVYINGKMINGRRLGDLINIIAGELKQLKAAASADPAVK